MEKIIRYLAYDSQEWAYGPFVYYDDHQAALDAVLAEAVWAMEEIQRYVRYEYKKTWEDHPFPISNEAIESAILADTRYARAEAFLERPLVLAWRARQKEQG